MSNNKKTQQAIAQDIIAAKKLVEVGSIYSHYKDKSKTYLVKEIAFDTEREGLSVIYQSQYGVSFVTFVRPLGVWLEKVEWQGRVANRFEKVEK